MADFSFSFDSDNPFAEPEKTPQKASASSSDETSAPSGAATADAATADAASSGTSGADDEFSFDAFDFAFDEGPSVNDSLPTRQNPPETAPRKLTPGEAAFADFDFGAPEEAADSAPTGGTETVAPDTANQDALDDDIFEITPAQATPDDVTFDDVTFDDVTSDDVTFDDVTFEVAPPETTPDETVAFDDVTFEVASPETETAETETAETETAETETAETETAETETAETETTEPETTEPETTEPETTEPETTEPETAETETANETVVAEFELPEFEAEQPVEAKAEEAESSGKAARKSATSDMAEFNALTFELDVPADDATDATDATDEAEPENASAEAPVAAEFADESSALPDLETESGEEEAPVVAEISLEDAADTPDLADETAEAPVAEAPVTEAPVAEVPVTEAPVTEAPVAEAPEVEAPEVEVAAEAVSEMSVPDAVAAAATLSDVDNAEVDEANSTEGEMRRRKAKVVLSVAILGASGIGKNHARWFHRNGCRIAGFLGSSADSTAQTEADLSDDFAFEGNAYTNLDELLQNEKPDIVCVATPPPLHFAHVLSCLEAGAHVLCEKPLVYAPTRKFRENRDGAKELVKVAAKKNLTLGTQLQYGAATPILCKLAGLSPTDVGDFAMELETLNPNSPRDPRELWIDLGPHPISVAQMLAGPDAKLAEDTIRFEPFQDDDKTEVLARFGINCADGRLLMVRAVVRALRNTERKPRRRFSFNGHAITYAPLAGAKGKFQAQFVAPDGYASVYSDPVDYLIGDFVRACRDGGAPLISGDFGRENLEWMLKVGTSGEAR